jgi:ligand-binding SRPBCC domain-containing protein
MKIYTLRCQQFLPVSIEEAWDFFSSPENLAQITPQQMDFRILHKSGGDKMYPGQIIHYRVSVLPFPPVRIPWTTEITHVSEPDYFVDEQRSGPYALWHHQHFFREIAGGVEMTDEVNYAIPLGLLGRLARQLFVKQQLNAIFEYRFTVLNKLFNNQNPDIRKSA